jgi:hypothetical protein
LKEFIAWFGSMPIMWSLLITVGTPPWIQSLTPTAIYLIYLIYRRRIFVENIKVKKNVLLFPRLNNGGCRDSNVRCNERLGGLLKYYHGEAA